MIGSMSALADAIYEVLRQQLLSGGRRSLTYKQLAGRLRTRHGFRTMHARNRLLFVALGEVVDGCRRRKLPALPAIVWRADLGRPGNSYYRRAHPRARSAAAQRPAWTAEYQRVIAQRSYPATI
jgi:hypothetical protein